jgi:hypothetical protein
MASRTRFFRFEDDALNRRLTDLLKKSSIEYCIDNGRICYSAQDADVIENELVCSIRTEVFPSWKVLTCPAGWVLRYKRYMVQHNIPFKEELSSDGLWFLIPGKYRPHTWKLDEMRLAKTGCK